MPSETETLTFYGSLPTETLERLREAFMFDAINADDTEVAAFCYRRIGLIERVLKERPTEA
jgi:hypothetical protein